MSPLENNINLNDINQSNFKIILELTIIFTRLVTDWPVRLSTLNDC